MNISEILIGIKNWVTDKLNTVSPFETGTGSNSAKLKNNQAVASGQYSTALGVSYNNTIQTAGADASIVEGAGNITKSGAQAAHAEGVLNVAGRTQEEAVAALTDFPNLSGTTEQKVSKLIGFGSHVEGTTTKALGTSSHAEGNSTQALVNATHAEGDTTTASGEAAHSEGYNTIASGNQAHAEGYYTRATANQSHAEGKHTDATSENAHAEGNYTTAHGNASHAEGYFTVTNNNVEHAEGQYNVSIANVTRHTVGIGNSSTRKNAHTITTDGKHYIPGVGNYQGTETSLPVGQDLATIINNKANKAAPIIAPDSGTNEITLNAGTKYKLTAGGGSIIFTTPSTGSADIYWATYGTSTYAEVRAALEAGKEVLMKYAVPPDEDEIWLFRAGWDTGQQDGIYFVATDGVVIIQTSISANDAWDAFNHYTYELQNNRVSTLSGNTSITNKYPNCKAVADYVKDIVDYPAGIYPFGTHSNIFVSNGNIVLWDKSAGSYPISLNAFYESYMKSIGAYNSATASSLSANDKIKQLAFMMANNCIIEVPAGSANITKTLFTYMNVTETAGSFVIDAFDYGASASGTRIRVTSGTVTITTV